MNRKIKIISFRKKGRYIYVATDKSGEIKFHPDICLEFAIHKDADFSIDSWEDICFQNNYRLAWESALRLLSVREHCKRDLSNKLRQRKFNTKVINAVINECKRLNFVDDIKFVKEYTQELLDRGNGLKIIKSKLMQKGIPESIIDKELTDIVSAENELEAAKNAYRKKIPSLKRESDPRKKKEKLYRYMLSKGFSYDIIHQINFSDASMHR